MWEWGGGPEGQPASPGSDTAASPLPVQLQPVVA